MQQLSVAVNDPTECLEFSRNLWTRAKGNLLYAKLVILVHTHACLLACLYAHPLACVIFRACVSDLACFHRLDSDTVGHNRV